MLDELEWPSLEARRDLSSLLLFHKIHCGAVSIDNDKYLSISFYWLNQIFGHYLTPAYSSKSTRSSHRGHHTVPKIVDTRHTVMP